MRPIHLLQMDKVRPVLVLTRAAIRPHLRRITVAPITTNIRGLSSEVALGPRNGLERPSVVSCDNVETVPHADLGRLIGHLHADQEPDLARAIIAAYGLRL
ncbi:type II toxin-antitoxin system PemK/MazF family toxin [Dactylosporangium sp. NPDC005572]|uniref:type II toxin-antitoxin system PemK/MazF family toxin n=1 Tax=Dactylosporangium sp. NPDC005572 TaxID=3156889 RepID=UPI0033A1CDE5